MGHREGLLKRIAEFIEMETEVFGNFPVPKTQEKSKKTSHSVNSAIENVNKTSSKSLVTPKNTVKVKRSEEKYQTLQEKLETCTTLEQLQILCDQTDDLKTDIKATNLVFGVGNSTADLMLIGIAPDEQEGKQGEPFVGATGQLLNKILTAIKFNRKDVYITNILKHRTPSDRTPTFDECQRSLPYLLRQIDIIQPKLILCLGEISATTLLKKEGTIASMRGKFYPFRNSELTVTYHPATLLQDSKWKRPVWEDVQRVRKRYNELGCTP